LYSDHTIIKIENTMSVKSLSELERKRGGAALRARLKHIDSRLVWFGFVRLSDHAAKFGISEVQGKIDLQTYRNLSTTPPPERKPGPAAAGGQSSKAGLYERPDSFVAIFDSPGTLDDLAWTRLHDVSADGALTFERLDLPSRAINPDAVRSLLAATELRESSALVYQSLTSNESKERIVCPHSLVKASGRWHIRAFDFSRKGFIDFSLPRVLSSTRLAARPAVPAELDDDWHAKVDVTFVPHPRLSQGQRSTIAREFRMTSGQLVIRVRRALLFYLLDEMRLLSAVRKEDEDLADVPIWVKNLRQVVRELACMDREN
jgi:hypothetical protein